MTYFLHYPKQNCSLADLAQTACLNSDDTENYTAILAGANGKTANHTYTAGSPIIMPTGRSIDQLSDKRATTSIPHCTMQEHKRLRYLSHTMGGAGLMAMADLVYEITKDNGTTFASGAGASMVKTSNIILDSIDNYQRELKILEGLRNNGGPGRKWTRQEPKTRKAFDHMNTILDKRGQHFLHKHAFKTREVKNLRGNIVRESIPINQHPYVRKLSNLAKVGKVAGPGMILLDGYLRYDKVMEEYRANNPKWQRTAFVESTSFAAGIVAAGAIATAVILMTPGGLLVAIVAGGLAAVGFDLGIKHLAGNVYDLF